MNHYIWLRFAYRSLLILLILSFFTLACATNGQKNCDQCKQGEERCSADASGLMICTKIRSSGCWDFVLKRCEQGLFCTPSSGGRLSCQLKTASCTENCGFGEKKCSGETVLICKKDTSSDCPVWFPETVCPAGQPCVNGACGAQGCVPKKLQHEQKCVENALYWFDDCGTKGAKVKDCVAPMKCDGGTCKDSGSCTPLNSLHEKKCAGNALYWFDDCGTKGVLAEQCKGSCEKDKCTKACTPLNPRQEKKCVGNVIHWFDDCGQKGAVVEQCKAGATCANATCTGGGCSAVDPMSKKKCVGNSIYWFDNCDKQRDIIETCVSPKKCESGACKGSTSGCQGTNKCTAGSARCNGKSVEFCNQNVTTLCFEWSSPLPCGAGQICSAGVCVQDPNGNGGARQCKVNIIGVCSDDSDCCSKSQTCTKKGIIKFCGPCTNDSDCPKSPLGQTKCCGGSYCALSC